MSKAFDPSNFRRLLSGFQLLLMRQPFRGLLWSELRMFCVLCCGLHIALVACMHGIAAAGLHGTTV